MILSRCIDDAQDYFARLGGSGRYEGFSEWHPFALVLMTLLETKESSSVIKRIKYEHDLPEQLWRKTDGLPSILMNRLNGQLVNNEMVDEFLLKANNYLEVVLMPNQMKQWNALVDSAKELLRVK